MSGPCPTCKRPGYIPDAVIRTIREQYAGGVSQADLAVKHGISQALVSNIVGGLARPSAGGPITPRRRYNRSTTRGAS